MDGTTVLGKLDWQFIGGKQLSNSLTAVAIAILTQESPAATIGVLLLLSIVITIGTQT